MPSPRHRAALLVLGAASAALALAPGAASAAEPYTVFAVNACDRAAQCRGSAGDGMLALAARDRPNVIAVNEACEATIDRVAREAGYHEVFTAAGRASCGTRGRYGNAILLRGGADPTRAQVKRYRYRRQAREIRTLTCVARDREVCVTHLDHTGGARVQARQLKSILGRRAGGPPTLLAGDLNLNAGKGDAARPRGWWRRDDGARMHVMSEAGTPSASSSRVPWSDHPILRVDVD